MLQKILKDRIEAFRVDISRRKRCDLNENWIQSSFFSISFWSFCLSEEFLYLLYLSIYDAIPHRENYFIDHRE